VQSPVERPVVLSFLLLLPTPAHADWPLATKLDGGVLVDVTELGLAEVGGLAGVFVPANIAVPPLSQADSFGCLFGFCAFAYDLSVRDLAADVQIDDLQLVPTTGALTMSATATVMVNSPSSPGVLDIAIELASAQIIDDTCGVWTDPISLSMDIPLQLALVADPNGIDVDGDGVIDTKFLDVTVDQSAVVWSWDASGDDLNFQGCGVANTINDINTVLNFFNLDDLYDLIFNLVEPQIASVVDDFPATIEPLLEDAFAGLLIDQQIDLLGAPLDLTMWPQTLDLSSDGLRLELTSYVDVPRDPCVADYGFTESLQTLGAPPGIDHAMAPFPPHLAVLLDDDIVNQLLFAVWTGGALCIDLADESLALPLPLDTSLLELLAGDAFAHLFAETAPIGIVTDPRVPPEVDLGGASDLNIVADPLGLTITAEVDHRRVRLMNIDVAADIGLDLDHDPVAGVLDVAIDLGAGSVVPKVTFNEFAPDATADIEAAFTTLFDGLLGPLLGGLTSGVSFPLPALELGDTDSDGIPEALGVGSLDLATAGDQSNWVGAYTTLSAQAGGGTGCDDKGGCDTSGCEGGCSAAGGLPGRAALLLFPLLVAGLRRA